VDCPVNPASSNSTPGWSDGDPMFTMWNAGGAARTMLRVPFVVTDW
jgi:hypothetical protein